MRSCNDACESFHPLLDEPVARSNLLIKTHVFDQSYYYSRYSSERGISRPVVVDLAFADRTTVLKQAGHFNTDFGGKTP